MLCDVELVCGGSDNADDNAHDASANYEITISAHRCVLASASPYFRAMFGTSGMRESRERRVRMHGLQVDVLRALIDYCYKGARSPLALCA